MVGIPSNQFVDYPVFNQLVPKEGPKTVPILFDFTAQSAYAVDLQNQQSRSFITIVQSVYVRNPGTVAVTILFDVAGQQVDFPPQSEGYLPVLVSNPPRFTATSVGGASNVQVMLLNVPMPAHIWPIVPYILPITGGAVVVSDTTLDGTVSGGKIQARQFVSDDNDNVVARAMAGGNTVGLVTAAGNTVILGAGGAGVGFGVSYINIGLSGNAALGAPGNLTINLNRAGTLMFEWVVSLPAVANTPIIRVADLYGLNWFSPAANQALQINLSAALTAGTCFFNVGGFLTAQLR